MKAFIGIDTSCYTTSLCLVDAKFRVLADVRKVLQVPVGKRGLSQSNMVYQHTRNLPELAIDWDITRFNYTEKNIMRLALAELVYNTEEIPAAVILNEAVMLAKEFCGEKAARFINGMLGTFYRKRTR